MIEDGNNQKILVAKELSKSFGGLKAVESVSFSIEKYGVTSIIGPNGAGKSTFFNLLNGATKVDSGRVFFKGEDITELTPSIRLRRGMARSFQITNLFFDLTVLNNLQLACQFIEDRKKLFQHISNSHRAHERAYELLESFGLVQKRDSLVGELSHGEQRRLEIAVTMASKPDLLLLDEPTQGMSHGDTNDTSELIVSLSKKTTVLLIEHDVELVMGLSKSVMVMSQGLKLAEGTPSEIRGNHDVQIAYFGESH